jgi:hypothetical protein
MAANEVKKDKLIDQLEKLIPAELLNDGESDRILRNAVADAIRKLKQAQGILLIQTKISDKVDAIATQLDKNLTDLKELEDLFELLGGGQESEAE